jgi:hypothetical protein
MADKAAKRVEAARPRKLVHVDEALLTTMAHSAAFRREFPFLASVARKSKPGRAGCGGCARAQGERSRTFQAAKAILAGLDSAKKRRLKELLGTRAVRVSFVRAGGQRVELTF